MHLDGLTLFGLLAVSASLACYAMENRARLWVLAFAVSNVAAAVYGFLQGAWPFGLVEIAWALVALHRWWAAA